MQKKIFDKIPTPVHAKSPEEIRGTRDMPQHSKDNFQHAHSQHQPKWGKTQSIFTKIRNKKRLTTHRIEI